ncbi:uncharacterized protein LOC126906599 [Daktulosphaira vitifoliae]|uniref:uncharacterized protein LOC126906599 n=1 Tax=Daktulosphaira vitifoliae TaxID=58002 RepID=UPI0021AA2A16|nr:uncharacterized protein LOC126906599 [Daktulosphaira vitifoliae]
MMIATTRCLYLVLNILYYTQKVSSEITMLEFLQNFVYSAASRQLNGVSVKFQGGNFISFEDLKEVAIKAADHYNNPKARIFLEHFQDHLPDIVYCKYAERITAITHYIYYLLKACKICMDYDKIKSLNEIIKQLVELVNSIQDGIHYVSQLGSRYYTFPNTSYLFLINPLNSGPIEEVGIQYYIDNVLQQLITDAKIYMTTFCVCKDKNNIPISNYIDEFFEKYLKSSPLDTMFEFLVQITQCYFTETNTFMAHLDGIYQNIFRKNNNNNNNP